MGGQTETCYTWFFLLHSTVTFELFAKYGFELFASNQRAKKSFSILYNIHHLPRYQKQNILSNSYLPIYHFQVLQSATILFSIGQHSPDKI